MNKDAVYIVLDNKAAIDINQNLSIRDVAKVYCDNGKIKNKVEKLKIYRSSDEEDWDYIDSNTIIEKILELDPQLDINVLGATEVLLEIKSKAKDYPILQLLKVIFVSVIMFFGAGIAIITFYEDVNMVESLDKIYYSFTGIKTTKPLIMIIPYSLGLGIGVMTFFSRIISSSKRRKKEPGPMEIELYLYDKDMEDFILNDIKIQNKDNKKHTSGD